MNNMNYLCERCKKKPRMLGKKLCKDCTKKWDIYTKNRYKSYEAFENFLKIYKERFVFR